MGSLNIYNTNVLYSALGSLALLIITMFVFYKLVKFLLPFATKPLLEKTVSDILPFKSIINDKYLKLSSGSFASALQVGGLDYSNLSEGVIFNSHVTRFNLLSNLATTGNFIKIFISKRNASNPIELNSSNNKLLNEVFVAVNGELESSFELNYFIFCEAKSIKELEDLTNKVLSFFNDLSPTLLLKSALLQFLWFLVNHNEYKELNYSPLGTNYLVSNSRVSFAKHITISNHKNTYYGAVFTLNSFALEANSNFINQITSLNMKLEIIINSEVVENTKAILKLKAWERLNSIIFNWFKAEQANIVVNSITNNEDSLVNSQFSFIIYGSSLEELEHNKKEFMNAVNAKGINALEEQKGMEIAYFNRLVGFNYILRPRAITASNLTHLVDFNAASKGLKTCDWGNYPLAYFKSYEGSVYNFFLHCNDNEGETPSAHSVSFAPTGTGKTFLFQHIIAGALYFYKDINIYCFDSNLGLKIFTESAGGSYLELKAGNVAINPLLLDLEDQENKQFLSYWFRLIAMLEDDESLKLIDTAVEVIEHLEHGQRKLTSCLNIIFPKESAIYQALEKFAFGTHKDLFNGDIDSMQLDTNRLFAFDMTNILKDETVCPAFLSYIMFVIRKQAKKTSQPHIVFIDETSAMLQNKVFAKYIGVLLKEHRKLRGSINIVFQNVSDIAENQTLLETVLYQCKTRLIFKNPDAGSLYQKYLNLTDHQLEIVQGGSTQYKHLKRPLLIQKDRQVAVLEADLKYLGNLSKFYSSSINNINLLNELKATEPNWYEMYKNS